MDYQKSPKQLIPKNFIDSNSSHSTCIDKLSGVEQLTHSKQMNDYYFTYHQLKMCVNQIQSTRRKPPHSMKTSLDIIHDINVLKHKAQKLKLPIGKTHFFDQIQTKLLGSNFRQPPLKTNTKIVKTIKKKRKLKPLITKPKPQKSDKEEKDVTETKDENKENEETKQNNNDKDNDKDNDKREEYEIIEKKESVKFKFDSSDLQRYLDANSEIIGRLQAIRRQKSFYGVTQEEIDLSTQFAENTAAIVQYSSLPQRLLI